MNFNLEYDTYIMDSFEFESGRILENVNVEYWVGGSPRYDADGNIVNAVIYFPNFKNENSILQQFHNQILDEFTDEYFFIKITPLGVPNSCSPSSTGLKYQFPQYTLKDRVNFKRQFLKEKFDIGKVLGLIGERVSGFEVYTWACEYPDEMEFIINLNTTFKTYGYRYVLLNVADSILDSSEDFYSDEYSVSLSKLIVMIMRLMFLGNFPKKVFEEFSNDEIDVIMEDYVDEGLFIDIYDFKSRNDCLLRYDVFDKLKDIKAKSLIMGSSDYLYFNNENDILPLKDIIEDSRVLVFSDKENFYDEHDYSDMGSEIISFLKQFQ